MSDAPQGLRRRVARGGAWLLGLRGVEQLFRLARLIILARLLAPSDFGLMGIAMLAMATLQTFSEPGFHVFLVREKKDVSGYLDTAWTLGLIRGLLLCGLLWALAPAIGGFFDAPEAVWVMKILALSIPLQAAVNVAIVFFQKELEFHKQFVFQLAGTLTDFVVSVSAAWILRSVWALILGLLAGSLVRLVLSYVIHPRRPRLALDLARASELWNFGRWLLGSSVLVFLSTQGDDVVVGKMLGATMLAYYQLAYRISNLPATEFSKLLATVVLPAFAKMQDQPERLRAGYEQVLRFSALIAFPVAGAIFILSGDFIRIFLGAKWMPMAATMQILALTGLFRSIVSPGPLFLALGKPQLRTRLQLVGLVLMALLIVPLTLRWGIAGTAVAATVRVAVSKSMAILIATRETGSSLGSTAVALGVPLFNTALSVGAVHLVRGWMPGPVDLWSFLLLSATAVAIYLLASRLCDALFGLGNEQLLRAQLAALRGK